MAAQEPQASSALPMYYGERMSDGTVMESPRGPRSTTESRDAVLRLPIQPHPAHLEPESTAMPPGQQKEAMESTDAFTINSRTPTPKTPRRGTPKQAVIPYPGISEQQDTAIPAGQQQEAMEPSDAFVINSRTPTPKTPRRGTPKQAVIAYPGISEQQDTAMPAAQQQEAMEPTDALVMNPSTPAPKTPRRGTMQNPSTGGPKQAVIAYPGVSEQQEEEPQPQRISNQFRPIDQRRRTQSFRSGYAEEQPDENQRPRPYQRPVRRHSRPPPSHKQVVISPNSTSRYSYAYDPTRGSNDTWDYGYEADTPTKMRYYESEDPDPMHYRTQSGGGGYKGPPRNRHSSEEVLRLPWTMWMNSNAKNHFVAFIGEFVGTTMFLFFAFSGTQVANIGSTDASQSNTTTGQSTGFSPEVLQYIALVFAFSLMVNVWVFFRISGGLFNPAVTFAMLLTHTLTPLKFGLLLVAQLTGAIFSSYLVSVLFPTPLNVRTTLSSGTSLARGVFIEAILTAELVFTIFMLAKEKHKATYIAPVGIGLALFIGELVGVYYTGGSLNPARSFGPCVVTGVFDPEHWIYWIGPAIGASLAVVFYKFIKILEYEMANPGQDDDDKENAQKVKENTPS